MNEATKKRSMDIKDALKASKIANKKARNNYDCEIIYDQKLYIKTFYYKILIHKLN